jgi:hypothetical protein
VIGQRLLPHDGDAELTVSQNQFDVAARWLLGRKWNLQPEFGEAWARIRSALYAPEFFNPERPLLSLRIAASDDSGKESLAGPNPGSIDERTARYVRFVAGRLFPAIFGSSSSAILDVAWTYRSTWSRSRLIWSISAICGCAGEDLSLDLPHVSNVRCAST